MSVFNQFMGCMQLPDECCDFLVTTFGPANKFIKHATVGDDPSNCTSNVLSDFFFRAKPHANKINAISTLILISA